jgi:hypothetical protein
MKEHWVCGIDSCTDNRCMCFCHHILQHSVLQLVSSAICWASNAENMLVVEIILRINSQEYLKLKKKYSYNYDPCTEGLT